MKAIDSVWVEFEPKFSEIPYRARLMECPHPGNELRVIVQKAQGIGTDIYKRGFEYDEDKNPNTTFVLNWDMLQDFIEPEERYRLFHGLVDKSIEYVDPDFEEVKDEPEAETLPRITQINAESARMETDRLTPGIMARPMTSEEEKEAQEKLDEIKKAEPVYDDIEEKKSRKKKSSAYDPDPEDWSPF